MINLLPDDRKRDIRAARTNVILLRYNFVTIGAILALAAGCFGFFALLHNGEQQALATSNDNAKKTASLNGVRVAAADYRKDLTLAGQIIDNGISYTDVIIAITKLMPDGAVLSGLSLNGTSFGQQITFQASASSYSIGEQLKQNFQSSKIFSNVFFQELSYGGTGTGNTNKNYPVSVTMSAKLDNTTTGQFNEN